MTYSPKQTQEALEFLDELGGYSVIELGTEHTRKTPISTWENDADTENYPHSLDSSTTLEELLAIVTHPTLSDTYFTLMEELNYKTFIGQYAPQGSDARELDERYSKRSNHVHDRYRDQIFEADSLMRSLCQIGSDNKSLWQFFFTQSSCQDHMEWVYRLLHPVDPLIENDQKVSPEMYRVMTQPYVYGYKKPLHRSDKEHDLIADDLLDLV